MKVKNVLIGFLFTATCMVFIGCTTEDLDESEDLQSIEMHLNSDGSGQSPMTSGSGGGN